MGQGTDSCGGYEVDYNPYEEHILNGLWTQRDGSTIRLSSMSLSHLRNARELVQRRAASVTFSADAELWEAWEDAFTSEIEARERAPVAASAKAVAIPVKSHSKPKAEVRGVRVTMQCHCSGLYLAREADLNRGWGLSCSKHCAAVRRDFNKPAGVRVKKA